MEDEWRPRLPQLDQHGPWILPSRQTREVLSWRIAELLMRRYPARLRLVETHPGGGQYDCLTLYDRSDHSKGALQLNRDGSAMVLHRFDGTEVEGDIMRWRSIWSEAAAAESLRPLVDELARMSGLPDVSRLPASSPEVISFRAISAILTVRAFSSERWECRMGYTDTSGSVGGDLVRVGYFERFPELRRRLRQHREDDFLEHPAYRFWFQLKGEEPQIGFEAPTGTAETTEGSIFDLMAVYERVGRRIWPVVWEIAGHVLP